VITLDLTKSYTTVTNFKHEESAKKKDFNLDEKAISAKIEETIAAKTRLLEQLQEEQEEVYDEMCPFMPSITNKSRELCMKSSYSPIYKRYNKVIDLYTSHKQQELGVKARKSYLKDKENVTITAKSFIKKDEMYNKNIEWLQNKEEKLLKQRIETIEYDLNESCTFKPSINKTPHNCTFKPFMERQEEFVDKKITKAVEIAQKEEERYSYKPRLNRMRKSDLTDKEKPYQTPSHLHCKNKTSDIKIARRSKSPVSIEEKHVLEMRLTGKTKMQSTHSVCRIDELVGRLKC